MIEAMFYSAKKHKEVVCNLCCHGCRIQSGKRGICGVRKNIDGILYSLVYGMIAAEHADPVEKKPLFHFLPGSRSFSISTVGCNMQCKHCQNHEISQYPHTHDGNISGTFRSPEDVVSQALAAQCASISYTYVEPTVFYEFAYETAKLARRHTLKNIFVSNGFMTPEVTRHLAPVLDGINIDLKAFTNDFYTKVCRGRLQPVLDTIRYMHDLGVWVEVTTLLIPGLNDTPEELRKIAEFICTLDRDIPWHVTAFHPTFTMTDRPVTPTESLHKARKIGFSEGLHFVYAGNAHGGGGENTRCPGCGSELIIRHGFSIPQNSLRNGCCGSCGEKIAGVWKPSAN